MMRAFGCAVLGLSLMVLGVDAGGVKDKVKDGGVKDKAKEKKKYEVPKDAIAGKVKSVDLKEKSFVIVLESGKDRKFLVDDKTEFWGPRGGDRGTGPEGLKDRCMEKGHELHVEASKDGKTATNVHLPVHMTDKKDDNLKKEKKDKKSA